MANFKGIMGQSAEDLHVITTQDPYFRAIGLVNFTSGQLWESLKNNASLTIDPNGGAAGRKRDGVYQQIMKSLDANFMHMDDVSKETTRVKLTDYGVIEAATPIPSLIGHNEHWSSGAYQKLTHPDECKLLSHVKTSRGGYVQWSGGDPYPAGSGTSASGELTTGLYLDFTPNVTPRVSGVSGVPRAGTNKCVKGFIPKFQLRLFDGHNPRNNERPMVMKGPPTFVAMPKTNFGKPYEWRGTDNDDMPPGQFADLSEGGASNPSNMVGGELDVSYNRNTGQFEAGTTQLIARLLDDIPAAPSNPIPDGDADSWTTDCWVVGSDQYTGFFATGRAVPMSVQHGNPYTFGPTWKGKNCKKEEKEILIAVNRAQRDYKAGETVMLNKIDGEWIILPMGDIDVVTPGMFGVQQWSFNSFIATATAYFRDNRYETELSNEAGQFGHNPANNTVSNEGVYFQIPGGDYETGTTNLTAKARATIKSVDYEAAFRQEFYYTMFMGGGSEANAALNLGYSSAAGMWSAIGKAAQGLPPNSGAYIRADLIGAKQGYYQTSNFDMVGPHMGGVNTRTILGQQNKDFKCDGSSSNTDDDGTLKGWDMYPFWGPIFPDGYRTEKITKFRNKNVDMSGCGFWWKYFVSEGYNQSVFGIATDANLFGGPFSYMENDVRKVTASNAGLQLPADIALNASPNGLNGRPMEDLARIQHYANVDTSNNQLYQNMKTFFERADRLGNTVHDGLTADAGEQKRFIWLADPSGFDFSSDNGFPSESTYDLKPNTPEKITFIPATVEWVASTDPHTAMTAPNQKLPFGPQTGNPPNHWANARKNNLGGGGGGSSITIGGNTIGKEYDIIPEKFFLRNKRSRGGHTNHGLSHIEWKGGSLANILPWDYRVAGKAKNKYSPNTMKFMPSDTPAADVVSVVAAKVKLRARASEIVFMTEQFLGVNVHATVSAGGSVTSTIIGFLFGGISANGPGPQTNSHPQWGYVPDNVESFGTIALHGRLYDQWPDEQTIYDPRYFSVLHFNPGTCEEKIYSGPIKSQTVFMKPDPATSGTTFFTDMTIQINKRDATGGWMTLSSNAHSSIAGKWKLGQNYPHYVDQVVYGVDHIEPTWGPTQTSPNGGFSMGLDGQYVPNNTHVFGTHWHGNGMYSLRPTGDWNISNVRRGMLLTGGGYKYYRSTIGAGDLGYIDVSSGDPLPGVLGDGIDGGSDFQVNDFLELYGGSGKGARLQVTAVEKNRRTGKGDSSKGAIAYAGGKLALKYVLGAGDIEERGSDYKGEDFPWVDGNEVPIKGASYKVKLLPTDTQSDGKFSSGREPRLRAGKVRMLASTDSGPAERGSLAHLSLGSSNGMGNSVGFTGTPNGRTKGTRQTSYNIASEAEQESIFDQKNQGTINFTTPVGSYDAFLYFHSDIGHVSNHGGSIFNAQQNYINLQITTQ